MTAARLAAARALLSLERGRTTLMAETERERTDIPDVRDRALFLEITAGTLRWRAELDACIAAASRRPIDDLMPEVRAVIRSGAYQLLHLDRVPAHAAVSEAVEVVRAMGKPRAAGLVNAVLRKLTTRDARRSLPRRPRKGAEDSAALDYLSVTLSHPRWLVQRWLSRVGFEATERWCLFNNTPPHITVRPAAAFSTHELQSQMVDAGVPVAPARFVSRALQLAPGGLGRLSAELRESLIVQDEGSLLVALAAGVLPGETVLDACAAPGGKTVVFAEEAGASGRVIASDIRPARVGTLRMQLQRAATQVPILALDVSSPLPFTAVFDRVVLDAPCSGLGTLRRDPDIKWSRQESDLTSFAEAQSKMIDQAADVVRPGGRLIYATCSSEPDENARVVDAFLARTPAFTVEPIAGAVDPRLITARGFLETLPSRDELDAFFAAKLVRSKGA
jgi:16S rRNA (cytosine967-C5)-methyltransferase